MEPISLCAKQISPEEVLKLEIVSSYTSHHPGLDDRTCQARILDRSGVEFWCSAAS